MAVTAHVVVDQAFERVRQVVLTSAEMHGCRRAAQGDERAVFADPVYKSRGRQHEWSAGGHSLCR
ncbi:MAG: hypothetical protein NZM07_00030 [Elioraea sp.]|nr:hypothetical protein [Elioraea sp.]